MARVYDYLLGGKDNFAADRAVGDQIIATLPEVIVGVRAQRAVLGRVIRYLIGEAGIRQLLDVGSGLPTADNVHEIARRVEPATRVVYVDNDPVVLNHATALLADDKYTFVAKGDLFDPASIIDDPVARARLDWDRPIGLLLCGIAHYILDSDGPGSLSGRSSMPFRRVHTSSSTTCWTTATRGRLTCRRRWSRASGACSSVRWRKWRRYLASLISSRRDWCQCQNGDPTRVRR